MSKREDIERNLYVLTLEYFSDFYDALYEGGQNMPDETLAKKILKYLEEQGELKNV